MKHLVGLIAIALAVTTMSLVTAETATRSVKVFLIALEDDGKLGRKVGCGDSVVAVRRDLDTTSGSLRAALSELLTSDMEAARAAEHYNALAQSQLTIKSVSLKNGKATVHLTGQLRIGGACDAPRVEAQIRETVLQFPTVKSATVLVNGQPLEKLLSGR